jgi:hypothetical protein
VIEQESNGRVLVCSVCDEAQPVRQEIAFNPELMMIAMEDMAEDHRECAKYPMDQPRAKREREIRKRVEKARRLLDKARMGVAPRVGR